MTHAAKRLQGSSHLLSGTAQLNRVGRIGFPVHQLTCDGEVIASLGRAGWIRIFLGRGQRVELADGSRWRIKSIGLHGKISPAIFDDQGRKIALSSLGTNAYGVNGRDFGFELYQLDKRGVSRANRWILRRHDVGVADLTRHPRSIRSHEPIHVGATLLAFTLVRFGILGEFTPRLKLQWSR
ncbi:MAG: hypothetical protein ACR2P0_09740 [Acidimicrobiales bacterium]